jgi:hypothetical protein
MFTLKALSEPRLIVESFCRVSANPQTHLPQIFPFCGTSRRLYVIAFPPPNMRQGDKGEKEL